MKILCRHGHFAFYEERAGEVADYCRYFELDPLERENDYFTFEALHGLPRYSIVGKPFYNLTATVTYEGRNSWDVMRENGFVYHVASELLLAKSSIAILINPPLVGSFFMSPTPLIQPGSRNAAGQQVLSYSGQFREDLIQTRISEFGYE